MSALTYKKIHLFIAITFILPIVIIFISGLILVSKQIFPIIQPPVIETQFIEGKSLLKLDDFTKNPEVDQIIYRPNKNNLSIRYKDDMEKQIHAQTGDVLSFAKRHTNWLLRIHQGSYFSDWVKKFIFIPTAIVLQILWISGMMLYFKTRKRKGA